MHPSLPAPPRTARTATLTLVSLAAFAANSLLCRMALGTGDADIDPATFTTLRLASGALVLWLLVRGHAAAVQGEGGNRRQRWVPPLLLFAYAIGFSFAYVAIGAATGALILFGAVQATMLVAALLGGERPSPLRWAGLVLALGGLVWLLLPGLHAPPLGSALAMAAAGVAWGGYSLLGRGTRDAVAGTAANFLRATPLALAASLLLLPHLQLGVRGALLAVASGALASGLGYVVWYAALRGLTASAAAIVQLAVPVLTALAAVLLLDEALTPRLLLAAAVILGGVALAVAARPRTASA